MKKREITKLEKPIPIFKREEGEWQTVEVPSDVAAICRALDDPIRATIFDFLSQGPVRQIDLVRLVNERLGRKYDVASIMHHLDLLEKPGLIAHEELPKGRAKAKMIYRAADVELRMRKRPKPEITPVTAARSIEEWLAEFRKKERE